MYYLSTHPSRCAHLLPFVLRQVGLELEVGLELAGAELALVGAVDHDYLLGRSLALWVLAGLHLYLGVPVLHGLPSAALWIGLSLRHTFLQLPWSFCNEVLDLLKKNFLVLRVARGSMMYCILVYLTFSFSWYLINRPLKQMRFRAN